MLGCCIHRGQRRLPRGLLGFQQEPGLGVELLWRLTGVTGEYPPSSMTWAAISAVLEMAALCSSDMIETIKGERRPCRCHDERRA